MYTRCQSVSCEGLILVRQLAAKWLKVRLDARVLNKIDPGPFYSNGLYGEVTVGVEGLGDFWVEDAGEA